MTTRSQISITRTSDLGNSTSRNGTPSNRYTMDSLTNTRVPDKSKSVTLQRPYSFRIRSTTNCNDPKAMTTRSHVTISPTSDPHKSSLRNNETSDLFKKLSERYQKPSSLKMEPHDDTNGSTESDSLFNMFRKGYTSCFNMRGSHRARAGGGGDGGHTTRQSILKSAGGTDISGHHGDSAGAVPRSPNSTRIRSTLFCDDVDDGDGEDDDGLAAVCRSYAHPYTRAIRSKKSASAVIPQEMSRSLCESRSRLNIETGSRSLIDHLNSSYSSRPFWQRDTALKTVSEFQLPLKEEGQCKQVNSYACRPTIMGRGYIHTKDKNSKKHKSETSTTTQHSVANSNQPRSTYQKNHNITSSATSERNNTDDVYSRFCSLRANVNVLKKEMMRFIDDHVSGSESTNNLSFPKDKLLPCSYRIRSCPDSDDDFRPAKEDHQYGGYVCKKPRIAQKPMKTNSPYQDITKTNSDKNKISKETIKVQKGELHKSSDETQVKQIDRPNVSQAVSSNDLSLGTGPRDTSIEKNKTNNYFHQMNSDSFDELPDGERVLLTNYQKEQKLNPAHLECDGYDVCESNGCQTIKHSFGQSNNARDRSAYIEKFVNDFEPGEDIQEPHKEKVLHQFNSVILDPREQLSNGDKTELNAELQNGQYILGNSPVTKQFEEPVNMPNSNNNKEQELLSGILDDAKPKQQLKSPSKNETRCIWKHNKNETEHSYNNRSNFPRYEQQYKHILVPKSVQKQEQRTKEKYVNDTKHQEKQVSIKERVNEHSSVDCTKKTHSNIDIKSILLGRTCTDYRPSTLVEQISNSALLQGVANKCDILKAIIGNGGAFIPEIEATSVMKNSSANNIEHNDSKYNDPYDVPECGLEKNFTSQFRNKSDVLLKPIDGSGADLEFRKYVNNTIINKNIRDTILRWSPKDPRNNIGCIEMDETCSKEYIPMESHTMSSVISDRNNANATHLSGVAESFTYDLPNTSFGFDHLDRNGNSNRSSPLKKGRPQNIKVDHIRPIVPTRHPSADCATSFQLTSKKPWSTLPPRAKIDNHDKDISKPFSSAAISNLNSETNESDGTSYVGLGRVSKFGSELFSFFKQSITSSSDGFEAVYKDSDVDLPPQGSSEEQQRRKSPQREGRTTKEAVININKKRFLEVHSKLMAPARSPEYVTNSMKRANILHKASSDDGKRSVKSKLQGTDPGTGCRFRSPCKSLEHVTYSRKPETKQPKRLSGDGRSSERPEHGTMQRKQEKTPAKGTPQEGLQSEMTKPKTPGGPSVRPSSTVRPCPEISAVGCRRTQSQTTKRPRYIVVKRSKQEASMQPWDGVVEGWRDDPDRRTGDFTPLQVVSPALMSTALENRSSLFKVVKSKTHIADDHLPDTRSRSHSAKKREDYTNQLKAVKRRSKTDIQAEQTTKQKRQSAHDAITSVQNAVSNIEDNKHKVYHWRSYRPSQINPGDAAGGGVARGVKDLKDLSTWTSHRPSQLNPGDAAVGSLVAGGRDAEVKRKNHPTEMQQKEKNLHDTSMKKSITTDNVGNKTSSNELSSKKKEITKNSNNTVHTISTNKPLYTPPSPITIQYSPQKTQKVSQNRQVSPMPLSPGIDPWDGSSAVLNSVGRNIEVKTESIILDPQKVNNKCGLTDDKNSRCSSISSGSNISEYLVWDLGDEQNTQEAQHDEERQLSADVKCRSSRQHFIKCLQESSRKDALRVQPDSDLRNDISIPNVFEGSLHDAIDQDNGKTKSRYFKNTLSCQKPINNTTDFGSAEVPVDKSYLQKEFTGSGRDLGGNIGRFIGSGFDTIGSGFDTIGSGFDTIRGLVVGSSSGLTINLEDLAKADLDYDSCVDNIKDNQIVKHTFVEVSNKIQPPMNMINKNPSSNVDRAISEVVDNQKVNINIAHAYDEDFTTDCTTSNHGIESDKHDSVDPKNTINIYDTTLRSKTATVLQRTPSHTANVNVLKKLSETNCATERNNMDCKSPDISEENTLVAPLDHKSKSVPFCSTSKPIGLKETKATELNEEYLSNIVSVKDIIQNHSTCDSQKHNTCHSQKHSTCDSQKKISVPNIFEDSILDINIPYKGSLKLVNDKQERTNVDTLKRSDMRTSRADQTKPEAAEENSIPQMLTPVQLLKPGTNTYSESDSNRKTDETEQVTDLRTCLDIQKQTPDEPGFIQMITQAQGDGQIKDEKIYTRMVSPPPSSKINQSGLPNEALSQKNEKITSDNNVYSKCHTPNVLVGDDLKASMYATGSNIAGQILKYANDFTKIDEQGNPKNELFGVRRHVKRNFKLVKRGVERFAATDSEENIRNSSNQNLLIETEKKDSQKDEQSDKCNSDFEGDDKSGMQNSTSLSPVLLSNVNNTESENNLLKSVSDTSIGSLIRNSTKTWIKKASEHSVLLSNGLVVATPDNSPKTKQSFTECISDYLTYDETGNPKREVIGLRRAAKKGYGTLKRHLSFDSSVENNRSDNDLKTSKSITDSLKDYVTFDENGNPNKEVVGFRRNVKKALKSIRQKTRKDSSSSSVDLKCDGPGSVRKSNSYYEAMKNNVHINNDEPKNEGMGVYATLKSVANSFVNSDTLSSGDGFESDESNACSNLSGFSQSSGKMSSIRPSVANSRDCNSVNKIPSPETIVGDKRIIVMHRSPTPVPIVSPKRPLTPGARNAIHYPGDSAECKVRKSYVTHATKTPKVDAFVCQYTNPSQLQQNPISYEQFERNIFAKERENQGQTGTPDMESTCDAASRGVFTVNNGLSSTDCPLNNEVCSADYPSEDTTTKIAKIADCADLNGGIDALLTPNFEQMFTTHTCLGHPSDLIQAMSKVHDIHGGRLFQQPPRLCQQTPLFEQPPLHYCGDLTSSRSPVHNMASMYNDMGPKELFTAGDHHTVRHVLQQDSLSHGHVDTHKPHVLMRCSEFEESSRSDVLERSYVSSDADIEEEEHLSRISHFTEKDSSVISGPNYLSDSSCGSIQLEWKPEQCESNNEHNAVDRSASSSSSSDGSDNGSNTTDNTSISEELCPSGSERLTSISSASSVSSENNCRMKSGYPHMNESCKNSNWMTYSGDEDESAATKGYVSKIVGRNNFEHRL